MKKKMNRLFFSILIISTIAFGNNGSFWQTISESEYEIRITFVSDTSLQIEEREMDNESGENHCSRWNYSYKKISDTLQIFDVEDTIIIIPTKSEEYYNKLNLNAFALKGKVCDKIHPWALQEYVFFHSADKTYNKKFQDVWSFLKCNEK